jgi:hypothetical protein
MPLVWFDLPLSISGCHRYWTQFVAAVAHLNATIYLAELLTNPIAPAMPKQRRKHDFGDSPWSGKLKRDTLE